jgi:hypothetical protein
MGVLFLMFQEKSFAQCVNFFVHVFICVVLLISIVLGTNLIAHDKVFGWDKAKKFTHSKREEIGINK